MVYVLIAAAGLWVLGHFMKAPFRVRWVMIGALYALVLVLLLVLPFGHPVQQMLGGSFGEWLVPGGLIALAVGYKSLLGR